MHLEKLEIQGFKSFASKNVLVFPGMMGKTKRGITAIVGPNGSGKSNVADAVRWALGEQSMKALRGKKSEDVIFSGSDKKGKLSMAEVSLFLNNEDKQAPIEYSQLVITRRLYRSGESEYLINGSRTRLSDIQMLLAKSKFGQKTYSVIGQGMVEGFLNTTLSERKEFFDEATGVKQYQIKRDEALNKLKASYENLSQAQMLLNEIEPRLKSLTRQVNKLQKRGELERELKSLQKTYYRVLWHSNNDKFKEYARAYLEIDKARIDKEKKMAALNSELAQMEAQKTINQEFDILQKELNSMQARKDEITKKIARLEAELEVELESRGQFDLSFLNNKKSELEKEREALRKDIAACADEIKAMESRAKEYQARKSEADQKAGDIGKRLGELQKAGNTRGEGEIAEKLAGILADLEEAEKSNDLPKAIGLISRARQALAKVIAESKRGRAGQDMVSLQEELMRITAEKEDLASKINSISLDLAVKKERLSLLEDRRSKLEAELKEVENRLAKSSQKIDSSQAASELERLNKELKKQAGEIEAIKEKISRVSEGEEAKRRQLFALQRNIQNLQNELNGINNKLNEIKIHSTRYETRLEDIEREIREEFGDLARIKVKRFEGEIDLDEFKEKIRLAKKQLELIGGIDPEVEKEYQETKERFDFLDGQAKDLSAAINSLEKAIKELDITIKEIFDKEFKVIQAKFEEYFKILFNGGKAKIIKVLEKDEAEQKPEDGGREAKKEENGSLDLNKFKFLQKHNATGLAGIEIQATPPGKKIKSISMLSGGERALTAIALICAIISANPSPFVVLDEVDAALDEANSERLAKILDDLSHKTQFIVITHNRATMRRANVLYGVTMGDDGISKLLSIKLEEAGEQAKK